MQANSKKLSNQTDTPCRSRRACDRCHAIKERCSWLPGSNICIRCIRLKYKDCRVNRPLKKAGRRRRPQIPRVPILNTGHQNGHSDNVSSEDVREYELESNSSVWISSPGTADSSHSDLTPATETAVYQSNIMNFTVSMFAPDHADPLEDRLLALCLGEANAVGRFTIGASFHKRHQQAMLNRIFIASPVLKDAFLSCAVVLASFQNVQLSESLQLLCRKKAATSISTLRALHPTTREELQICLVLGVAIMTFALCEFP